MRIVNAVICRKSKFRARTSNSLTTAFESFVQGRSIHFEEEDRSRKVDLADTFSFYNCDVSVDWEITECVYTRAWERPPNFQFVDFGPFADAQHFTRVMR